MIEVGRLDRENGEGEGEGGKRRKGWRLITRDWAFS